MEDWAINYFEQHSDRTEFTVELIESYVSDGKILELGAAPFNLTIGISKRGHHIQALDLEPERFDDIIEEHNLDVARCDIEEESLPVKSQSFDMVVLSEVFEHLRKNPQEVLDKINDSTVEDGLLILTTPNFYSFENIVNFILGRGIVDSYEEFKKLDKLGNMGHVTEYTKEELTRFLNASGFEIVDHRFKDFGYPGKKGVPKKFFDYLFPFMRSFHIIVARKEEVK